MRRSLLWFIVALLSVSIIVAFSLGGCKEAEEVAAPAEEEVVEEALPEEVEEAVEIVYTSWRTEDIERVNRMNAVFMEKHPNIIVKFDPIKNTEYDAQIKTALEAGVGADLLMMNSYDGGRFYYDSGYIAELSELIPALAEYDEVALGAFSTEDGIVYGVPLIAVSHGVYYNKDIFDKYGLEEPETWAEFLDICQVLKDNGEIPIAQGIKEPWSLYEVVYSGLGANFYGGEENRKKLVAGELKMTDEPFVRAFKAMLELVPYFPDGYEALDYVSMQQLFVSGQAAMFIGGSWEIGVFKDMGAEFEMGWFPPPVENEGDTLQYCFETDAGISMNKDTKHFEEALEYLTWLAGPEYAELQMNELPGFYALAPGEYELTDPLAKEMLDVAEDAVLTIRTTWEKLSSQEPSGNMMMWDAMFGLYNGDYTPEEAAAYVQENLETWYEPFME